MPNDPLVIIILEFVASVIAMAISYVPKTSAFIIFWTLEELRAKRKKQLKKDTASKIKSLVEEVCSSLLYFLFIPL